MPFSRRLRANVASSTKPEVDNASQRRRQRQHASKSFQHLRFLTYASRQTDKQADGNTAKNIFIKMMIVMAYTLGALCYIPDNQSMMMRIQWLSDVAYAHIEPIFAISQKSWLESEFRIVSASLARSVELPVLVCRELSKKLSAMHIYRCFRRI